MQREGTMLFSIIVPVYNVERYLPACIKSVAEQTGAADWECILVDDGSTDCCGKMCDVFAETVPGVRVLHQQNAGLAAARNTGVKTALGEWVLYLDSDDALAPGALQKLRELLAAQPGYDWYVCRYEEFDNETGVRTQPGGLQFTPGAFESDSYSTRVERLYTSGHWAVWKYCLRRSFLQQNGIEFWPGVLWAEDWPYDLLLLHGCTKLYFADVTLLYYRANRSGSLLNTGNLPRRFAGLVAAQTGFARLFAAENTTWTAQEQETVWRWAADVFWPVARTAAVRDKAIRHACAPGLARCKPLYDYGTQCRGRADWVLFRLLLKAFGARFALWVASLLHRE